MAGLESRWWNGLNKEAEQSPPEAGFSQGSAHHADKPPRKWGQAAPLAASSRLTVVGERPQPLAPTGVDSPPSNGRIQHPRDVCGTKNQSAVVVIPHPCGDRETRRLRTPARIGQNRWGRTSGALCTELEPSLCHLWLRWGLEPCSPACLREGGEASGKGHRDLSTMKA